MTSGPIGSDADPPATVGDPDPVVAAGLVIVDKPSGMTSHDVISRCRRAFGTRRVGHAGTLDPMATGVLVVGIERATKLLGLLTLTHKAYTATVRLGAGSDTDDSDGLIGTRADVTNVDAMTVLQAMSAFTGKIDQVPSRVSAIKVDGRRAHALARAGVEVDLPARRVTVSRFDMIDIRVCDGWLDVDVEVDCSSGTYVRALARDLGAALGVGGHLTALRRTAVGPFTVEAATLLDAVVERPTLSLGIDAAIALAFARREVDVEQARGLTHGQWLQPIGMPGVYAALDPDGRAIALLREKGARAAPVFVVRPSNLA